MIRVRHSSWSHRQHLWKAKAFSVLGQATVDSALPYNSFRIDEIGHPGVDEAQYAPSDPIRLAEFTGRVT